MPSSKMMKMLENQKMEELRMDFTPGIPSRYVVSG